MYIIPIAWLYVTLMMAVAEATSSNGSMLGALITFVLYGVLPVTLVVYLMRSPARRRAIRAREARAPLRSDLSRTIPVGDRAPLRSDLSRKGSGGDPDTSRHAAAATQGDGVAPVREET